jgi:hypothetical protein
LKSLLPFLLLIAFGCSRVNKKYDYVNAQFGVRHGNCSVKLEGSFASNKKITERTNPYTLLVAVTFDTQFVNCSVIFDSLTLAREDGNKTIFSNISKISPVCLDLDGKMRAYFSVDSLWLNYENLKLTGKCGMKCGQNDYFMQNINVDLKKDYKEYRSNDLWDRWMSV